jgi:cytochrome c-type biogenesis protein CcmH/NrfG
LRALEINPQLDATWNNLGQVYLELDKPDSAADAFEKAFALNANSVRSDL